VRVVHVRVQERHGDRLDAELFQLARHPGELRFLQRLEHLATRIQALVHRQAVAGRDQRLRQLDVEVVDVVAPLAADVEHVGVAGGRDERRARAFAFDERVRDQRRAVHYLAERRARAGLAQEIEDHGGNGLARIVGRGRRLADPDAAGGREHGDAVGERAADVDRYAKRLLHERKKVTVTIYFLSGGGAVT